MSRYWQLQTVRDIPRLPLEGGLDPTYRCNNNCRHCWIGTPAGSSRKQEELSLDEIRLLVDEARKMGCRKWSISGGEPMLRNDFAELFDYITRKCLSYSLNTNGTLITPPIARLMKRKGLKMVALYGATSAVHDHVTRSAGSFEALMQGIAYLKEAEVGFIVQIIPLRDNYHQYKEMVGLAESLCRHWRIGAPWLYLSAAGDCRRNQEIMQQRLDPKDALHLDEPDLSYEEAMERQDSPSSFAGKNESDRLFSRCISEGRSFHVDPYGGMTFCPFITDPALRYDLRKGSFEEGWEQFIPSLADSIRGGPEYAESCGNCEYIEDCRWCPVYGYLEHGRFSAKVEYLCAMAKENRLFKIDWRESHRRYYQIAGMTLQVDSDLPITDDTFDSKFKPFEVPGPGEDTISIRHHFSLPEPGSMDLGKEVYREPPWAIFKKNDSWIYVGIAAEGDEIHKTAVFNHDHTRARIYSDGDESFLKGGLHSLTLFPTDQILLARLLADRDGCYLHSSGVSMEGEGLLFVGHSGAGKSTMVTMLKDHVEILCDDRIIVRLHPDGFRISGTWSHGDVAQVSAASAPLKALFFLEQADRNYLEPLGSVKEILKRLLPCLIKPFVTASWWDKMLSLVHRIASEVPCYALHFDQSGKVVDLLRRM